MHRLLPAVNDVMAGVWRPRQGLLTTCLPTSVNSAHNGRRTAGHAAHVHVDLASIVWYAWPNSFIKQAVNVLKHTSCLLVACRPLFNGTVVKAYRTMRGAW